MKNSTSLILLTLVSLILSCSSDDVENIKNTEKKSLNTELSKLKVERELDGEAFPYATRTYYFKDKKISKNLHYDGDYDEFLYEGDLVSKIIEFNSSADTLCTITYKYDNLSRIISKDVNIDFESSTMTFTYNGEEVDYYSKNFTYNDNKIKEERSYNGACGYSKEFELSNNFISQFKSLSQENELQSQTILENENSNYLKYSRKDSEGNTSFEAAFNYSDEEYPNEYHYLQFMFGEKWKMNSFLNSNNSATTAYQISKNYISDYTINNFCKETNTTTIGSFSYEFYPDGKIYQQIETLTVSPTDHSEKIITTYFYGE